ncbi:GntR family transcriptional regulator [Niabella ginsenosidivorans]|uniref:GntR family transcriptional regulator n=1 Tax=Niabella ginsenosidivorans TaxID=1176587 RepID=A0A1A9I9Y4_9BACT|nr:rhamnogalacturonan acetylesterase [Niabella ginsenosidivorans]ANH83532.1 GntR family transcriptional regulator [Niabella ginsenosidivorans]
MKNGLRLTALLLLILSASFIQKKKITIFLAGDSTMAIKDPKAYPETGWGMPFAGFWNDAVTVHNYAKNGRSTRSFRQEGLWDSIIARISKGDYVLIQFGHNDEVPTKKTYTTTTEFSNNLVQYIKETINKGAHPVLLTPVARRKFDASGKIEETHKVYAAIVRAVAAEQNVPLIDLDQQSQQLYQQLGVESSKLLFNYLQPGEHPNYPDGKKDDTHFNELGARKIAAIVLSQIRILIPELASYISNQSEKK